MVKSIVDYTTYIYFWLVLSNNDLTLYSSSSCFSNSKQWTIIWCVKTDVGIFYNMPVPTFVWQWLDSLNFFVTNGVIHHFGNDLRSWHSSSMCWGWLHFGLCKSRHCTDNMWWKTQVPMSEGNNVPHRNPSGLPILLHMCRKLLCHPHASNFLFTWIESLQCSYMPYSMKGMLCMHKAIIITVCIKSYA